MLFCTKSKANNIDFYEKLTIGQTQNLICKCLKEHSIGKEELSLRLGKDKKFISRILSNDIVLTVGMLGRILHCMGLELKLDVLEIEKWK